MDDDPAILYTFLFTFRRRQYAQQVRERSVAGAIRKWAAEFNTRTVRGFGELSKRRLIDAVESNQFGPNAAPGVTNVWQWSGSISEFDYAVSIVATVEAPVASRRRPMGADR